MPRTISAFRKYIVKLIRRDPMLVFLWTLAFIVVTSAYFLYDLPNIDKAKPLDTRPSIAILANDGTLIARYGGLQGDKVEMRDIPQYMVAAVLAIEDRRFYSHFGIDPLGMMRAMSANILAGGWVQGGSTITQQLAKNMFLTPDKTLRRKVQEAIMALWIEQRYTKDQILLAYLNRVYFGAGAYGVDAAAKTYFRKPARQLSLWESAVLAGLLKAPTRYSPATNPEKALARGKIVLTAMQDAGYLTQKQAETETANARVHAPMMGMAGDLNRYFADWVLDQIDSFVATTDSDIFVKTTLDAKLQLMAESKMKGLFKQIPPEDKVTQAALVTQAMDGGVLAMIGGVDYGTSQFNRATQAFRQPGSCFKPFVFLAALESGFDPDTVIDDSPIREGSYRPENYDNKYFGEVTLTEAMVRSLNTATIRLLQLVGMERFMDVTSRFAFSQPPKRELASGLGATEVSLLELTNAYTIIGNGGRSVWPYAVLSIKDANGNLLYQHERPESYQVFSGRDISMLDSMLQQVLTEEGTGTAAQLSEGHVAGKTGTTQNYRDAWFEGYTDDLVTGIWMGNDDNTPMTGVTGGKYPAQLWHNYMNEAIHFDVPEWRPAPTEALVPGDFADILNRWSAHDRYDRSDEPVYNR